MSDHVTLGRNAVIYKDALRCRREGRKLTYRDLTVLVEGGEGGKAQVLTAIGTSSRLHERIGEFVTEWLMSSAPEFTMEEMIDEMILRMRALRDMLFLAKSLALELDGSEYFEHNAGDQVAHLDHMVQRYFSEEKLVVLEKETRELLEETRPILESMA